MELRPLVSTPPPAAQASGGVPVVRSAGAPAAHADGGSTAATAAAASNGIQSGQGPPPSRESVQAAVTKANEALQANNRAVEFSVDPDSKVIVVKLVDTATRQILRQIPAQEMLELARALSQEQERLLPQNAA